jgi:hypothetical protein
MAHLLEGKIEDVIEQIIDGKTFREIAEGFDCSLSHFHRFLSKAEHSARVKEALEISSNSYADKAEEVLINAEKDSIEMTRARELAQHYRWKASKRSPKKYGDKLETDNTHSGKIEIVRTIKK